MVQYYGLNSIAPIDSEFEPNPTEYDHCYCEIVGVDEVDRFDKPDKDISEILYLIEQGGDSSIINTAKKTAIENDEKHLAELKSAS
jgi:hypothetical protein